jgi:hypothetical protein
MLNFELFFLFVWNLKFVMKRLATYSSSLLLLFLLAGCYDMTIQVVKLPGNTPTSDPIYISGNFNNWDPGDPSYILRRNKDSVLEVSLPKGVGEIEYKFTRGDWSTVEKDPCGFEVTNHSAIYGRQKVLKDSVRSWNDLPKPGCPSVILIIDSLPQNTPPNAVIYLASNFNNWDPGSRYWMFSKGPDGKYYIEVPLVKVNEMEFKITRGGWGRVECRSNGEDIDNRVIAGHVDREIRISVEAWKDKYDW